MTDHIADMLNRIKNAQAVGKPSVEVSYTKSIYAIAQLLEHFGFIKKFEVKGRKMRKVLEVTLQYRDNQSAISGVKRISKPGQRIYVDVDAIPRVKGGQGIAIISTSKGLLTDRQAKKENIGGELVCKIW